MLFKYKALNKDGSKVDGSIDTVNMDVAISSLQRRGLVIVSIDPADKKSFLEKNVPFFSGVPTRDIVILSRQMATLFDAEVSALRTFRLLATETENKELQIALVSAADDIQGGMSMSSALGKHSAIFSDFYVNMVKAGEESGKLNQTFIYLADYLDRSYELTAKTRNALIYPAFVVSTFAVVMILMLTMVIPKLTSVLTETGQAIPFYTKIVLSISGFLVNYGFFFLILLVVGVFFLWRFGLTEKGKMYFSRTKIEWPIFGNLYKKLYLSRISDNMNTMLSSGISMVRAIEITGTVVGSEVYKNLLKESGDAVKAGSSFSDALAGRREIPSIMVQMVKIGEETGELGNILSTLAKFYKREVDNAVDTLVGLIEPILIVSLGLGVGLLLVSVLVPIYSITAGI
ncbi:MAG: type II secretion system F family protein [Patescibacteria group bacterium]